MISNVFEWLINTKKEYPDRQALIDAEETYTYAEYYAKSVGIA